jgi:hypothetical protein
MRLVAANPGQFRLDGPIAAPGKAALAPATGPSRFLPTTRQHQARSDGAQALRGLPRSSFACAPNH